MRPGRVARMPPMPKARCHCGLYGIVAHDDAVGLTHRGLFALQHRGQESAGITATDGRRVDAIRGMGLVADVFSDAELERLSGLRTAIGHVRYSTTGSPSLSNIQPLYANYARGWVAVAHNGNLTNGSALRKWLEARGSIFQTTNDTEVLVHLLALPTPSVTSDGKTGSELEHLFESLRRLEGAFSFLVLLPEGLVGARDRHGFRPLWLGKRDGAWAFASETAGFDVSRVESVREVEPGEAVILGNDGSMRSVRWAEATPKHCFFEHVYFARPDSRLFGDGVHEVRKRLGAQLAREHAVEADVVIPIPESGNSAALGYSMESGIPLDYGFVKNHYVGRSFIEPGEARRERTLEVKLNVVRDVVRGKRVIVVDDSVIRGSTAKRRVRMLREAGVKEVHLRISCPPHRHPCYYGIDFQHRGELIAAQYDDVADIAKLLDLDSMGYLSTDGMLGCATGPKDRFCTACWTGDYPIAVQDGLDKFAHEQASV